jgi:hypothetical protein
MSPLHLLAEHERMIAMPRRVWIIGSGFSKSLGGPLLRDLFRQQKTEDILPYFPADQYPDLAVSLPWVQAAFKCGQDEGLWENAEQFIAFVVDAYREETAAKQRLGLLINRIPPPTESGRSFRHQLTKDFNRQVTRALAAECERFLMNATTKSEQWRPYVEWARSLDPAQDTVLSFNYDRVIELAVKEAGVERNFWFAMPSEKSEPQPVRVAVLKLHGSVDWTHPDSDASSHFSHSVSAAYSVSQPGTVVMIRTDIEQLSPGDILRDPKLDVAIAAPGGAKAQFATTFFSKLWDLADQRMKDADELLIVGYSFPDTDPMPQMRLLNAFGNSAGNRRDPRSVHIVMGADQTPASHRLVSLVRSTAKANGSVSVTDAAEFRRTADLRVVLHPLGAQDFVGRHSSFTTWRQRCE